MLTLKENRGCFKKDDLLYKLNGNEINDIIDLRFYVQNFNQIDLHRAGKQRRVSASRDLINSLAFEQEIPQIKKCSNACVFCFLKQLPKGLRKTLYFNDDDWRLSFLCGNFITLNNVTDEDLKRIAGQRISPLYISVHATEVPVRRALGLKKEGFALRVLEKLDKNGIQMHLQIVLCPGINDRQNLQNSLDMLQQLKYVKSVGIVPVGLTRYHRDGLKGFSTDAAKQVIEKIHGCQSRFCSTKGSNWVYLADEFYLMAGLLVPDASYYDDFDQLENGIGLVRSWLDNFNGSFDGDILGFAKGVPLQGRGNLKSEGILLLSGRLFGPVISKAMGSLNLPAKVQIINNEFFGSKITVAGLLTAQDIIKQVKPTKESILIPDIMVNDDNLFLDNMSFFQLKKHLPSAVLVPSSGKLFANWLNDHLFLPTSHFALRTPGVS